MSENSRSSAPNAQKSSTLRLIALGAAVFALAATGIAGMNACDDTGPSPKGRHDSGAPETPTPAPSTPTADAGDAGNEVTDAGNEPADASTPSDAGDAGK